MKKITTFAAMAAAIILMLSSCSGSGSEKSMLFGSLPSEYAELKAERDKLKEKAINTEEELADLLKKGQKLDEKWTPKLEKSAQELDGKEINITDSIFKVTAPVSLTFEKLAKSTLEPIFNINGSAETAEPITIENNINPSRLVYLTGYDAAGNKVFQSKVGRITGTVNGNTVVIPAGTPIEFSTLTFDGAFVDKYPEVKTLKFNFS